LQIGLAGRDADNPALLPASVAKAYRVGEPERVDVGVRPLQAYRYDGTRSGHDVRLYVTPTDKGVATVACVDALDVCDRAAQTLEISRTEPFPLGADAEYGNGVSRALARLAGPRSRLAGTRKPQRQAVAATAVARAYAQQRRTLQALRLSPADQGLNRGLVESLRASESAYRAVASAARRNARPDHRRASAQVTRAAGRLRRAVARMRASGYADLVRALPAWPTVPTLKQPRRRARPAQPQIDAPQAARTPAPVATPVPTRAPVVATPAPTSKPKPKPTPVPIEING
jgi:hypothetical protein